MFPTNIGRSWSCIPVECKVNQGVVDHRGDGCVEVGLCGLKHCRDLCRVGDVGLHSEGTVWAMHLSKLLSRLLALVVVNYHPGPLPSKGLDDALSQTASAPGD